MAERLERSARRALLTPTSVLILVGSVFVAFVLRDAFTAAHTTIGWVVACSVVALLIDPLISFVDRFLPRWLSVIVVLIAVVAVVAGVVIGIARELADSVEELKDAAPQAAADLERRFAWAADIHVAERVTQFVQDLDERLQSGALSTAAQSVPTYVVTGILMLFILGYGRRYINSFIDQFNEERQVRLRQVIGDAGQHSQYYIVTTFLHCIVNGVLFGLVCWALGLPAAISLGVLVGLFTMLPMFGVVIGGIPALLLAFGSSGWDKGVVVVAALALLQLAEILVVRPHVDRHCVHVGPTVPIIAALLGFELYGVGGAVYSVALSVILLAVVDALGARPAPQQATLPLDV